MFSESYEDVGGAPSVMDSLSGVLATVKDAGSSVASYFKSDTETSERKFQSSSSMQGFGSNGVGNSGGFQNSSYHSDNKGFNNNSSSSQTSWRQDSWKSESSFTRTNSSKKKKKKKNKEVTLDNFFDDTDESDSNQPKRRKKKKPVKKKAKKKQDDDRDSGDDESSEPKRKKKKQSHKQKGKRTPKPKPKPKKKKKQKTPEPSESESEEESSFEFEKVEVKKPKKTVKKKNKSKTKSKLPKKAKKPSNSGSEDEDDATDTDDLEAHFESKKEVKKKKKGQKTKSTPTKDEDVPNLLDLTPKPKTTESLLDNIVNPPAAPGQATEDIFSYTKTSDSLLAPQPLHNDILASASAAHSPFDALMNQQQRPQPQILGMGPSSPMMGPATFMQPMPGYGQTFPTSRQTRTRSNSGNFPGSRQTRSNSGNFQGNVQMQRGRSNSGQGFRGPGTFGSPAGRGFGYVPGGAPMYGYAAHHHHAMPSHGYGAPPGTVVAHAAPVSHGSVYSGPVVGHASSSPFVSLQKEKKKTMKHMSFAARMDAANFSLRPDGTTLQTTTMI